MKLFVFSIMIVIMFHLEPTANSVYSINSEYLLKMCARASTSLPLPKNQPDTRQNETEGVIERGKKNK